MARPTTSCNDARNKLVCSFTSIFYIDFYVVCSANKLSVIDILFQKKAEKESVQFQYTYLLQILYIESF